MHLFRDEVFAFWAKCGLEMAHDWLVQLPANIKFRFEKRSGVLHLLQFLNDFSFLDVYLVLAHTYGISLIFSLPYIFFV